MHDRSASPTVDRPVLDHLWYCLDQLMKIELEKIEALEMLAMTLTNIHDAEQRNEVSIRMPILLSVRDKLAAALRDQS